MIKSEKSDSGVGNFTFKKWGRRGFCLYSVLKRVVRISVLPVSYFLAVPVLSVAMERDTTDVKMQYDLDEVEVSASRVPALFSNLARVITVIERNEIERVPVESIEGLLEYVAAVDVRNRGAEGVQADISIRGGSFDQTLILLNGINISDPQTGHHHLNLPVGLSQIERIEILKGPAARVYGPNAFSGAINIITKQPEERSMALNLSGGSFGYFNSNLSGTFHKPAASHLVSGSYKSSDGYIENTDFDNSSLFYSGRFTNSTGKISFQAGVSEKKFGANSFYTPKYPDQYEETSTLFSSVKWESFSKFNFTPVLYWRRHFDKFMLFRDESPDWYLHHNFHRTDAGGGNLNTWYLWGGGKTAVGIEFRSESIISNVLGEDMESPQKIRNEDVFYTKTKSRGTTSLFIEHVGYFNDLTFSAGAMVNHISDSDRGWNFFPGIDISYQLSPLLKMVGSWNSSLRMPTFTDLYYSGPTNAGNPDLQPEQSVSVEGGIKITSRQITGQLILFHRKGTHLIDWVKEKNEDIWRAMNHTKINSRGADISLQYFPQEYFNRKGLNVVYLSYLYNSQTKDEGELISYYLLDNLRHKFVASVNQSVLKNLTADIKFIFQKREGTFSLYKPGEPELETPYDPFWLVDLKIAYKIKGFNFFISGNNLFNREYFDLGNVVQPGRWIKTGISCQLNFKQDAL